MSFFGARSTQEEEGFVNHVISQESAPLRTLYAQVQLSDVPSCNPLHGLPDSIHGRHLVAVLQALRLMLREVRARKAELDRGTVWNPREGLKPLPGSFIEQMRAEAASLHDVQEEKDAWWDSQPDYAPSDASMRSAILMSADVDMIGFMCLAWNVSTLCVSAKIFSRSGCDATILLHHRTIIPRPRAMKDFELCKVVGLPSKLGCP